MSHDDVVVVGAHQEPLDYDDGGDVVVVVVDVVVAPRDYCRYRYDGVCWAE